MSELSELCARMKTCTACDLAKGCKAVVPGEGAENAKIVFIGEAPGWHEDQQGRPFVGPAGQFLEQLLASIGLKRSEVYICNVIKCRPPNNRDPLPIEIDTCRPWLDKQLELIKPKMIVTLGRYSMARYFPGKSISRVHGTHFKRDGIIYFAMYHPAAALHQQSLHSSILEDMQNIPRLLAELNQMGEEEKPDEKAQQLSLF